MIADNLGNSFPTMDIAISTMWGIGRFDNLHDFFQQGVQLGFINFELNHKVTSKLLDGIYLNGYSIPVVHEPCPADIDVQTLKDRDWMISAIDESNRVEGVRIVKRSIDFAHDLGAHLVVVHAGQIPGLKALEESLVFLFRNGQVGTPEYAEKKDTLVCLKAKRSEAALEAVFRSLVELSEYAGRLGIRLGLENRYHFSDFPGLEEMKVLLNRLNEEIVGFWYDVGHAQALDRLGFYPHQDWLDALESRMVGVHLHDVIGIDDHFAPGLGEVNWQMVASHLNQAVHHTLEVQNFNSPQQILNGLQLLVDKKCIDYL